MFLLFFFNIIYCSNDSHKSKFKSEWSQFRSFTNFEYSSKHFKTFALNIKRSAIFELIHQHNFQKFIKPFNIWSKRNSIFTIAHFWWILLFIKYSFNCLFSPTFHLKIFNQYLNCIILQSIFTKRQLLSRVGGQSEA